MPSARPRHFIRASVNADGRASPASGRELRRHPGRARRGPRGSREITRGYCRQYAGHNRGYRVTTVRICPAGGFRYARAAMAHIGPEGARECAPHGDRNRRGGMMILICQLTRGRRGAALRIPRTGQFIDLVRGLRARREFGRRPTAPRSSRHRDQLAAGGSGHHGIDLRCRGAPVRVRHQRPGSWRPAAARLPDAGTVSVQPRPAKSGASPDASFLIRSPTFPHGTPATGDTSRAGRGFKRKPLYPRGCRDGFMHHASLPRLSGPLAATSHRCALASRAGLP
jgi:hypothetical protein